MKRLLILICLLPAAALAEDQSDLWTLNMYLENDLFNETDRHYTNGIRFSWVSPDISSYETDPRLPRWVRDVNNQLHFFHNLNEGLERNLVISLGQLIFTPENVRETELVDDDRPYAGYLYLGFAYHTRSQSQLDTIEVNMGLVGPASLAEDTQDFIHDLRGFDKFQGWDNQLENELGLQLVYEHKHRFSLVDAPSWPQQDFIGHSGISLGNVASYVNIGGEYRIGWQLPDDFGTAAVRAGGDNSAPGARDVRRTGLGIYGLHAFVSADARLVANDIFLDGNTFEDSHSVDKKNAVADLAIGFSFLMKGWKLSYAKVFRTREFDGQDKHNAYGSLSISYSW